MKNEEFKHQKVVVEVVTMVCNYLSNLFIYLSTNHPINHMLA